MIFKLLLVLGVATAQEDLTASVLERVPVPLAKPDTGTDIAEYHAPPAKTTAEPPTVAVQPDAGLDATPKLEQQIKKHRESLEIDLKNLDTKRRQQSESSKRLKSRKAEEVKARKQVRANNKIEKLPDNNYSTLRDDVVDLLHSYRKKYPQCIYIPPQMIPEQSAAVAAKSAKCKVNFVRGWAMGANWARFIFGNKKQKLYGWSLLTLTARHFKAASGSKKGGIGCGYKGLQKSYFLNFERLEEKKKARLLTRYSQLEESKYTSLKQLYSKLKEKV